MRDRLYRLLFSTPPSVAFRRPWPGTRRGMKLWLLSAIVFILGVQYLVSPIPPTTEEALSIPRELMPLPAWGVVIMLLAAFAAYTAYCHHGRDRWGYTVIGGLACGWTVSYALAPLAFAASTRAFSGAAAWLVIAIFVFYSAGDEA